MKTFKQVVMVAALVAALALNVSAAEGPKPSGTVSIESRSIAAGIGVSWGDGKLISKAKKCRFPLTV